MAGETLPGSAATPVEPAAGVPPQSYGQLFLRFLRFGLLAWGGPVAQIAMIRQELVEEQRWISRVRFNRVLAVYQVLPGPEAHELVRLLRLPGSRPAGWPAGRARLYAARLSAHAVPLLVLCRHRAVSPLLAAAFAGCQVAVAALIIRAVHRIGEHALSGRWLWAIAVGAGIGQLFNVPFYLPLGAAALIGALNVPHRPVLAVLVAGVAVILAAALVSGRSDAAPPPVVTTATAPSALSLFSSGLRAGLFTLGGAYTAIPFVQRDAVELGGWMSSAQFLDGLALSGILPAPLVIFVTFVGYLGGGLVGALAMTAGMFLPAFLFTLLGHDLMERMVERPGIHAALDGVAAGVVGLIAATALQLLPALLIDPIRAALFLAALGIAYPWKSRWSVLAIIGGAALAGLLLLR